MSAAKYDECIKLLKKAKNETQYLRDHIQDLRTQYLLAFYPKNIPLTKEHFHRLEVRVKDPQLRVLARSGYYGEAESDSGTSSGRISVVPPKH